MKSTIKTLVAAPLLLAASQSFALYCGSDTNQNHINAGRAELMYGITVYTNGSNEYIGLSGDTVMLQETSAGYFQKTTQCSGGGEEQPETGGVVVHENLGAVAAQNTENTLKKVAEFSGKNYHVAVAGSDLVEDTGHDMQADKLSLPRTVWVNIPENAVVEAAYVNYYGSAFLTDEANAEDNTDDTVSGSELGIDTVADIENNEINITVGNNDLGPLTPSSAAVGEKSESIPSWWEMFPSAGTLEDSKIVMWNNRLDLTANFTGLTGSIPVTVTRLQRADFTGASGSAMESGFVPSGANDNGAIANDCLANASYSVIVVYYLPQGEDKTISIYDGIAWGWNNDFATSYNKAHRTVPHKVVTDIQILHDAIDATGDTKLYLAALDGDEYGHSGVAQCGSTAVMNLPHDTGKDKTWIKNGSGAVSYYENIYEGPHAPAVGTSFPAYDEVKTVANGLNFNIISVDIQNDVDNAVNTLVHVEGDNPVSTDVDQEAMLISFAILEAKTMEQSDPTEPTNTAPVVTMNGAAEITLTVGDTFTDPGATATDAEDGEITPEADCNVSTSTAGTYTCTYTATDSGNLSDTKTRTVIVEEDVIPTNTAPVVTLNGATNITLEYGAAWADPGATATDTEDGAITPVADCPVNTQQAGTYTCTYTATDSGNLSDSKTRTVVVEEEVIEPTCTEYTASYDDHVNAGRAEVLYYSSVYVKGSGEYLGSTYLGGTATLIETAPGQWAKGNCP